MKKILYITLAAVAIVAIAAFLLFARAGSNSQTAYVYIDNDDDLDSVCAKTEAAASPTTTLGLRLMATVAGYRVRTGQYAVAPGMSMVRLFRNLRNHSQEPVRLVIPEVRTLDDLAGRLSTRLMLDSVTLARAFRDPAVCRQTGMTTATMPALFVPNTYEVWWDMSLDDFLNRMRKEHDRFWNEQRKAQAQALALTPVEVQTLASIVDAESSYNPEKPRIAGLYLNRLHAHMPLQSDPTVIFALGDFSIHRVSNQQTRFDSPYNTYRYEGLPPGPIRIASVAGIDAVLQAEHHDFFYMCAKEDFSGSHNFATTYAAHQQNARRYTEALNQRGILK